MTSSAFLDWQTANQRYLSAALAIVREHLRQAIAPNEKQPEDDQTLATYQQELETAAAALPAPAALETLCQTFGLTPFERDLLLFCAGLELDSGFIALCRLAQSETPHPSVTFSLALASLPNSHWSAILPESPLRYWRMIEVTPREVLALSPLRLDERILHYLTGMSYLDDRLVGLVEPITASGELPQSHQAIVERILQHWRQHNSTHTGIYLTGAEDAGKLTIAAAVCDPFGMRLYRLRAADIPASITEREALARLWEREAILSNCALVIDCDGLDQAEMARSLRFIERLRSPLIVLSREPLKTQQRSLLRIEVHKPSTTEQYLLWQSSLGSLANDLNGQLEPLVMQFNLSPQHIQTACLEVATPNASNTTPKTLVQTLWDACRSQARSRLEDLAQRIEPAATWEDLVLPDLQLQTLRQISAHLRQRSRVYETWGFSSKGDRGLGISALFAGMSGTGKTMAAEVLAHELRLDLYRIDLSSVVSKYIGETEKNLRRVFDAAETGGAILLFDEADALFGKRSEVKDSHDRYANIEVSYLLQRMEAYRGLAILTTNLKSAIDHAFLRRIRFIVQFPFPDAAQRAEIWRRIFPVQTPIDGLDVIKLGRLNVAGGNIRNIALNAAFLAADAGESVQMRHLLQAAQSEYTKLEKSLTNAEIGGWV